MTTAALLIEKGAAVNYIDKVRLLCLYCWKHYYCADNNRCSCSCSF